MAATTVHRARVVAAKVAVVGAETAGAGAKEATVVEAMVEAKARLVVMVATMAVGWAAEEAALATRVEQMVVLRAVAELAAAMVAVEAMLAARSAAAVAVAVLEVSVCSACTDDTASPKLLCHKHHNPKSSD